MPALTNAQKQEIAQKYVYIPELAEHAVNTFHAVASHTKDAWAGKPFILEPWQKTIVEQLFGWRERETLKRRYKTLYLEVPRKNGKTAFVAGLLLTLFVVEGVKSAEAYAIAATEEQANIVMQRVKDMIRAKAWLSREFDVWVPSVYYRRTRASLKALTAKPTGKHGLHTTYLLADEIHEWPDEELYQFVSDGMAATYDPLEIKTTTAGKLPGVGWNEHNYAKKIRDGLIFNPRYLPVIYAADHDDEPGDPATWKKANPNYGVSVSHEYLEDHWLKAQESPRKLRAFLRYNLNIWKEGGDEWIPAETWAKNVAPGSHELSWKYLPLRLRGRKCYGGLDLSKTMDLSAFVLYFPPESEGEQAHILSWFWFPQENMEQRCRRDRVPYDDWTEQGAIKLTPGNVIDYSFIRADILKLAEQFDIEGIAYDPWNAEETRQKLQEQGIEMIEFRQSMGNFAGPTREIERQITGGELNHGHHPVLAWNVSNAVPYEDAAGNMRPSKRASREKIDGFVALIMARGLAMAEEQEQPPAGSYLETDRLMVLR